MRFLDKSGVGRYAAAIVRELLPQPRSLNYVLLARPGQQLDDFPDARLIMAPAPYYSIREQIHLPLVLHRSGVDLFHSPHFVVPLGAMAPIVSTIHDVAYLRSGEDLSGFAATVYYQAMMHASARRCQMIVTSSHFSKHEIADVLKVDDRRIAVIPGAVASHFHPTTAEEVAATRTQLALPARPYFLYLGIHRKRKNLQMLLRAFAQFRHDTHLDHMLVLAGPHSNLTVQLRSLIHELRIENHVHFTPLVRDNQLPALLTGATALTIVSIYEGFGLPVLEAMACDTPVICSDTTSLPEVAGGAAMLVDPYDSASIAQAMAILATDLTEHGRLAIAGQERAKQFSWINSARLTLELHESLL